MATLKFYDANEDGTFNVRDINLILQQHPNLPLDKQQEFESIAMGLVGQSRMVTPGTDVPGAQTIEYDDPTTVEGAENLTTGTVMDQGVGGTSGFGFDSTDSGFNPQDREEVSDYLTNTLGLDASLVSKINSNINLYDPTKEQQLQTQYGFDVGALGQQQRGSILEGIAGAGQQAFAGRGLVSGRRRAGYRQGISEAQRQFETGLAQKQFGLTSNILEAQKDYDFVGELNKLKELGQLSDGEFQSAVQKITNVEEAGSQGNVPQGYATQQDFLDSEAIRGPYMAGKTEGGRAGSGINTAMKDYIDIKPAGMFNNYYGLETSSWQPKWKGFKNEQFTIQANPYVESAQEVKPYDITVKWPHESGAPDKQWEILSKTPA